MAYLVDKGKVTDKSLGIKEESSPVVSVPQYTLPLNSDEKVIFKNGDTVYRKIYPGNLGKITHVTNYTIWVEFSNKFGATPHNPEDLVKVNLQ